ncbi:hypothetical protein BVG84_06585 [Serratia marcescens]|nr:hypothetical protein BVG84_06585 [Serratia marcescens]
MLLFIKKALSLRWEGKSVDVRGILKNILSMFPTKPTAAWLKRKNVMRVTFTNVCNVVFLNAKWQ